LLGCCTAQGHGGLISGVKKPPGADAQAAFSGDAAGS